MSIVAILTDPGKGGTFLTWSLHYLAGHTHYFNTRTNNWNELTNTPLTNVNAHNFQANQVHEYKNLNYVLTKLSKCKTTDFHTVYMHNLKESVYSNEFLDTKKAVNDILSTTDKIVVLTNQSKNSFYEKSFHTRSTSCSLEDPTIKKISSKDQLDDFVNYFFNDSINKWKELNLINVWDQREFLALNLRYDTVSIAPSIDLSVKHYSVDCMELFNLGDKLMQDLCDYLGIKISNERIVYWNTVYLSWRKIHYNRLNFLWCFDKIINYILNNYYMDLTRLKLDIVQEALIQHELIYKHHLNLKTWQLEKFTDTQQLHGLLEPNIHPLGII